jgi:endonuclease YncB( thermonuclease family)
MTTFGPYPARCDLVHDGDTVYFSIDLGFDHLIASHDWNGHPRLALRVLGINAPELSTDAGKAALVYAQTILHVGDICQIVSHGWDKYGGRFDGSIALPTAYTAGDYTGTDYATLMLAAGQAVVMA